MARGRFISRGMNHNARLEAMSIECVDFFKRLIAQTDVEGRVKGKTRWLREELYGLRDDMTPLRIERWLNQLSESKDTDTGLGLLERYEVDGRACLWLPGFEKHQRGLRKDREAASEIPPPPAAVMELARKSLVAARGAEDSKAKRAIKTDDLKVAAMIAYYEKATGRTLTPTDVQRMVEFADDYEDGWFEKAVDEVVASTEPIRAPIPYIGKTLENWKVEGKPQTGKPRRRAASGGGDSDYEDVQRG